MRTSVHAPRFLMPALAAASCFLLLRCEPARAGAAFRVASGEIRVRCPMTIGGSFEAKTSAVSGDIAVEAGSPARLAGSIDVDLTGLDTGIDLRNNHLREKYLEVDKPGFDKVTLSGLSIAAPDPDAFRGKTTFKGTLKLHGAEKEVGGPIELRDQDGRLQVEASFPVLIPDYGIDKPRHLGVGVKDEVTVRVHLILSPKETP